MTRYIIECDDPEDIVAGARLIQRMVKDGRDESSLFRMGEKLSEMTCVWTARKTKSGYSAKKWE